MTSQAHFRGLERAYVAAPVTRWMGTRAEVSDGRATVHVEIDPRFHHVAGAVHGSLYFRMLDDAAFFAANSRETEVLLLTASFHLDLFRPVVDGTLRAEGRVVNESRRVITAEAELFDETGSLLARGSGSFMQSGFRLADAKGYLQTEATPDVGAERTRPGDARDGGG